MTQYVSSVRFSAASCDQARGSLLEWASFLMGERLRIYGVAIRRTPN